MQVEYRVKYESKLDKILLVLFSAITGAVAFFAAAMYFARYASVLEAQRRYEEIEGAPSDIMIYDIGCLIGPFTNDAEALRMAETGRSCLMDKECRNKGAQWSFLYIINAPVMVLFIGNMFVLGMSANRDTWRYYGGMAVQVMSLIHIVTFIVTAYYRFTPVGMLCAYSLGKTYYTPGEISDHWTYYKDG